MISPRAAFLPRQHSSLMRGFALGATVILAAFIGSQGITPTFGPGESIYVAIHHVHSARYFLHRPSLRSELLAGCERRETPECVPVCAAAEIAQDASVERTARAVDATWNTPTQERAAVSFSVFSDGVRL